MPQISKQTLSQFMKTDCYRQLKFILSPHDNVKYAKERQELNIPPRQEPRPGMALVTRAGVEWEREKYTDVRDFFSGFSIIGVEDENGGYKTIQLSDVISRITVNSFIMQSEYKMEEGATFEKNYDIEKLRALSKAGPLEISKLRPDIIQVLPPMSYDHYVRPDGKYIPVENGSTSLQLKIIDIKHTAEPSVAHFSELAYYMITLSCWLADNDLSEIFQVVSGSVWPGSHDASAIRKNANEYQRNGQTYSSDELLSWLNADLIEIPFEVFASRIDRFFKKDLLIVLQHNWEELPYHVDSSCKHCDYLGYPWKNSKGEFTYDEHHCMQLAIKEDSLSRIADMSVAAKKSLVDNGVHSGAELASISDSDAIFESHQTLKSKRVLYPKRAVSLIKNEAIIPDNVGTSSVMPKWSDLSIFLTVDFDITSAITACVGMKAIWINPKGKKDFRLWPPKGQRPWVHIVEDKDVDVEKRVIISFLEGLQSIIDEVRNTDPDSTYQIYVWDSIQYDHLKRVISRHLESIIQKKRIKDLVWLFPSDETIGNPDLQRQSPITIVKDCISSLTALPIPHYYSLLETARTYGDPENRGRYSVHPLFEDALSDQVPSERMHEIWTKIQTPSLSWTTQLEVLIETVGKRLSALHSVTLKLQRDLRHNLIEKAPKISKSIAPSKQGKMCYQSELMFMFSKLDAKLDELDILAKRALPIYEREARYDSAKLIERLSDKSRFLNQFGIANDDLVFVYKLSPNSVDVRAKDGDFMFALSPSYDATFLNKKVFTLLPDASENIKYQPLQNILTVTILKLDREQQIVILKAKAYKDSNNNNCNPILSLESAGVDFSKDVSLDPVTRDFFTPRLREALQCIGNPPSAQVNIDELTQLKQTVLKKIRARKTKETPASKVLWDKKGYNCLQNVVVSGLNQADADKLLEQADADLNSKGMSLNNTQQQAWKRALTDSISIIWGPPGTGKSKTLIAIINSAVFIASTQRKPLRILITSFTYTAIDNLLLDVSQKVSSNEVEVFRLCSDSRVDATYPPELTQISSSEKARLDGLRSSLKENKSIIIVGAPPQQVHRLLTDNQSYEPKPFFDIIIVDEASQLNLANAVLAFSSLAMDGSLILAGDGLQLPPIHRAEMPLGCDSRLGSVYDYYKNEIKIDPTMLAVNYRSNAEIVNFIKEAGYKTELSSYSPALEVRLDMDTIFTKRLPNELYSCEGWKELLDPAKKICCFTYPDGISSQWNEFEVDAIASLCFYLKGSMYAQLKNERGPDGSMLETTDALYTDKEFWSKGIGIVTPHRAQQSKLTNRLISLFANGDGELQTAIIQCVDTVERFQGQQRDIIFVSFALGDIDMIGQEEEFIMNLNRFNVMISRARAKVIVFLSEELAYYLANDIDVLKNSRLLSTFANTYCGNKMDLTLGYIHDEEKKEIAGLLKYD